MVKHSSRIQLSHSALKQNFNFLRKKVSREVRLSSVVKANAYGHGITSFVPMAEKCGIRHFAVASSFEAEEVLAVCSPESSIMIMGIIYEEDIPWALKNGIELYIYNFERLQVVARETRKLGLKAKIHLEVETGANRTGLPAKDFSRALTFLKKNKQIIEFEGLCSHLGGAESLANKFKIDQQLKKFKDFLKICRQRKFTPNYRHIASSAGALAYPESRYDMVRVGVAQYGFWPAADVYFQHIQQLGKTADNSALKRVITWKTDIMDIRWVESGEFVGYGTAYQATHRMRIAVLPLGYSNGYPRALSNRGHVLVSGKKAPVLGLINMNLFMVDISHISHVEVGDEVVLIGRQKNAVINVSSFTNPTQLLNNEMLSRLPEKIPRRAVR